MTPLIEWTAPAKTVSESNRRDHWAAKARRTRMLRTMAKVRTLADLTKLRRAWAALSAGGLHVHLVRSAPSMGLDSDSVVASQKAVRDGVADALGIDDRDPRVVWTYGQTRGPYAVTCTVEAAIESGDALDAQDGQGCQNDARTRPTKTSLTNHRENKGSQNGC